MGDVYIDDYDHYADNYDNVFVIVMKMLLLLVVVVVMMMMMMMMMIMTKNLVTNPTAMIKNFLLCPPP